MRLTLGDAAATCPSLEQLQGIVDPLDPCQAAQASVAGCAQGCSGGTANYGPFPAGTVFCETGTGVPPTPAQCASGLPPVSSISTPDTGCPAGQNCSLVSNIPNVWIYGLAAALGVLLLSSMMGGGRR